MLVDHVRRVPALILLVLLALLPLFAWFDLGEDPVVLKDAAAGLDSVQWVGSVAADGRLSVAITYDFSDDSKRNIDIRVPNGARYLSVNGVPIDADVGQYASTDVQSIATVTYELPGAITRYRDGALLRLAAVNGTSLDGDEAMFPCPRCYIDELGYGNAALSGAIFTTRPGDIGVTFIELNSIRAELDDQGIRFVGIVPGAESVSMFVTLPSDAVSELPIRDGSIGDAVAKTRDELSTVDEKLSSPLDPSAGSVLVAVILTALFAGFAAWILIRMRWTQRVTKQLADGEPASTISVQPSDLEPALVGAVVGDAGPGNRSVVAATLLAMARRNVVSFTGDDMRRFVLEIPQGATGETSFENAVLASLRPDADAMAAVSKPGPLLWGAEGPLIAKKLQLQLIRQARKHKLVGPTLSIIVMVTVPLAMAVTAIVGSDDGSGFAWFMAFAGPILGVIAAVAGGIVLTKNGLRERGQWVQYGAWMHDNRALRNADIFSVTSGPAAVSEQLPYAAALGVVPDLAFALSPRRGR